MTSADDQQLPGPDGQPEPAGPPPDQAPAGGPAPPPAARSGAQDVISIVVGLGLVLPALVALLYSYVLPSLWTLWTSFQASREPLDDGGEFVGFDNYEVALRHSGFLRALLVAGLPLLTLLVLAPVLAFAAHRAGRPARWAVRLALTVPMVCYAPMAIAVAWQLERFESGNPESARWGVPLLSWLGTFGLVCGLGVTLYLSALRRRDRDPGPAPLWAVLAVGGLAALTVVAVALQAVAFPLLAARPDRSPIIGQLRYGLQMFNFGPGAAIGTVLLIVLAGLGVLAVLVVIASRLRIEFDPSGRSADERPGWDGVRIVAALVAAGLLVLVFAVAVYGLWPWLSRLGNGAPEGTDTGQILVNTWVPPLITAMVSVLLALLAGFGIGALRPFGRWSELLLLPFAPWLFVGGSPLVLANTDRAIDADQLDSFAGLIPPGWVAIPALVLFTVLFRGLRADWQRLRATAGESTALVRGLLVPALPMVVLVGVASWVISAQTATWQYVTGVSQDKLTGPMFLLRSTTAQLTRGEDVPIGLALSPVLVVVFALALGVLQVWYLDRVAIRVGKERP